MPAGEIPEGNVFDSFYHFLSRTRKGVSDQTDIRPEQIELLFRSLPIGIATTLLIDATIYFLLSPVVAAERVVTWVLLSLGIEALRAGTAYRKSLISKSEADSGIWFRVYLILLFMQAAIIGSSVWVIFPDGDLQSQMLLIIIVIGVATGGAFSLASHSLTTAVYVTLVLAPLATRFFVDPQYPLIIGILTLVLAGLLINSARVYGQFVIQIIDLQDEKQGRIEQYRNTETALRASEVRFRDFSDSASDWLWEMDENLRFSFISDLAQTLSGVPLNKMIGQSREDLITKSPDKEKWRVHLEDLKSHKPFRDFTYTFQRADGTERRWSISGKPIFSDEGAFQGYRGTGTDITEKVLLDAGLTELRDTLDQTLDCLFTFEPDSLRFTYVNQGAIDQVGYSKQEMMEMTPIDIKPEFDETAFRNLIAPLLANEVSSLRFETIHKTKNGGKVPVEIVLQYLQQRDATAARFVAVVRDITERMQAEERLRQALVDAKQASQAKSDFLAIMSHELRTPLNAIIGFSEMIKKQFFGKLGSEKYSEYAHDIHDSGEHLLALVNDILDLSAIEAGKQPLVKEGLMVREIVTQSSQIIATAAKEKNIEISVEVSNDIQPLYADRRAVKQILFNLLSNAVKYTPDGGKITLKATTIKGFHVLEISDTGIGIPADKISNLTDPFVRTESDPHLAQEGSGLGLAIVKPLVDLHGGKFEIKSEVGVGTTATVSLPTQTS
jgi:PAS domain S-box-containing protein